MGCATQVDAGLVHPQIVPGGKSPDPPSPHPSGKIFPDVSDWQGHPNWSAAKPYIAGAAVKAGENLVEDPDFAWNVAQLHALRIPTIAYWFVRPGNCAAEARAYVSVVRSVGGLSRIRRLVLDEEVPGIAGYAGCMDQVIHAELGVHAVIYTAPGTWPGGSNAGLAVWEAEYGPSLNPVWHPVVAWQFTDGAYGAPVYIPGIGQGDVSVDYGILGPVSKPRPRVICLGAGARRTHACHVIQGQVRRWERAAAASARVYAGRRCGRNDHELAKLRSRRDWFARHLHHYPRVRHATRERALRSTGRAIARELVFLRREQCVVSGQRARYFSRKVAAAERKWAR